MWQKIPAPICHVDVNTCTIKFDIYSYWWDYSLGGRHSLSFTFVSPKGHVQLRATSCLDETDDDTLVSRCVYVKIRFLSVNSWMRQSIHNTLILVDRFMQLLGIKRFQTRRSVVWDRFIPHSSQVLIYMYHKGVVDSCAWQATSVRDRLISANAWDSFLWRLNGSVTLQITDLIKWPNI